MKLRYVVKDRYAGSRLREFLKSYYKMSNTLIKRLKYKGQLTINGSIGKVDRILGKGDVVIADLEIKSENDGITLQDKDIEILYEDEHMICINKPPGICTHPVRDHRDDTLANRLLSYYRAKGLDTAARPVSRLDKDTSGLITFAKNSYLQDMMKDSGMQKEYMVIVNGRLHGEYGVIKAPILRDTLIQRKVDENGKYAETGYEVISTSESHTLVKAVPKTGRTHQIRLHMMHIGHPILGESLYSDKDSCSMMPRQALHSYRIRFRHPVYGYEVDITAPMPDDMQTALRKCGLG